MPKLTTLELTNESGKFVLEPLERGYGQTLGNALRRMLLSSIHGAAVNAIKIDKVLHEFAPIPGVKEDATQFILNLKGLALAFDVSDGLPEGDQTLRISVKGPGVVTGADVQCPPGVRVANPEVYLATISDPDVTFNVEMFAGWGVGYVLPEKQERYRGIIGVLPVGSQYTPVRKVNYVVEQTRVQGRTDFERLLLEVETNGAVTPNDAVTQAAHILSKYVRMFFDLGEATADVLTFPGEEPETNLANVPDIRIEEMALSQRTFNCLRRAGLLTLRDLARTSESDLSSIKGFGKKSLLEVLNKLAEYDIQLKGSSRHLRALEEFEDDEEFDD
ncbi:MAG: DNA-directed RNA polymerase subunit alpha [Fimbriimonadaceae bacterium]